MRFNGIEIPRDLINAHKAGQLVLFVGAGASMGRPANLPSFLGLTELIRDESELGDVIGRVHDQPLDEVLGEIEDKYDVDVHLRAMKHTAKKSSLPNSLHAAIARLSLCGEVRIVTTNYDTHLSTTLGAATETYLPPALPMGSDFTGLVYLHGSVTQAPNHLVVTARDFGRAYLTEAWATRFLERMFATYTTLFVGYSHNDVIMKYLARGLGPDTKPRYAFTHQPDSGMWKQLNIAPVGYSAADNHRALVSALSGWAQRASSGLLDHQRQIKMIMEGQTPADLSVDEDSYLDAILGDENVIQFFCAYAQGPEWLEWIADKPEFRAMFDPQRTALSQVSWRLSSWFAETYITANSSVNALTMCRSFGGQLSPVLWDSIARRLVSLRRSDSSDAQIGPWLVLLTRSAPMQSAIFLDILLSQCRLPEDRDAAILLFSYLTEPQIVDASSIFGGMRGEVRFRGNAHQLQENWDRVFKTSLGSVSTELLPIIDQHLRQAQRNIHLNDEDAGETLGSPIHPVAATSGGGYEEHLDLLVGAARDCVEAQLEHNPDQGMAQLSAWAASEMVLLKRLAIHGWTVRRDASPLAQANWLADQGLILAYDYQSEITPLLLRILDSENAYALKAVVNGILAHADDDQYTARRALRTLHWMRERVQSEEIDRALAVLTDQHNDLRVLLHAIESASASESSTPPSTLLDEVALLLQTDDLPSTVALLDQYAAQDPPPSELAWFDVQNTLAAAITRSPATGFDLLDAVPGDSHLRPIVETSAIRGWSNAAVDDQMADLILQTTSSLDISEATNDVARMLAGFQNEPANVAWAGFNESRDLARRCWEAISTVETEEVHDNSLHNAINTAAGQLALYWIDVASHEQQMTSELSAQVAGMLTSGDSRANSVEFIVGLQLSFLHSLDSEWCEEHVIPLFSWEEPERAVRAWSGYLSSGRVNDALLRTGLIDDILDALSNASSFREDLQHNLFGMLAQIALHSEIDRSRWLARVVRNSDTESRARWADEISNNLRAMSPDEVEAQWTRWIRPYWSARIQSVPRRMNFQEASAMAPWVIYLDHSLSDGVDLARQCPAGLVEHSHFLRDLTEERIAHNPDAIALLLAHLLSNTELPYYGLGLSDVLQHLHRLQAPESSLGLIAEHAFRLGLRLGDD